MGDYLNVKVNGKGVYRWVNGDEYDGDRAYSFYRPIKSKKIQKRIDLTGRIHDILDTTSANWIKVKKISILIANNYRRRAR